MFENPRRGRQGRNFTKNVPEILDLKSASEQIFSENWRWDCHHGKCITIKRTTPFSVRYDKIRIQLRKVAADNAKVFSLARKTNTALKSHSITFFF